MRAPNRTRRNQPSLFDEEEPRALLDQLLADARVYRSGREYRALLEFVTRLRNFAPFNAMLLHLQKPGLSYAASAHDWRERFGRWLKPGARPLLILWPFGPVALVYDVLDTEGAPLPEGASPFAAHGPMDPRRVGNCLARLAKQGIECLQVDAGDHSAGSIEILRRPTHRSDPTNYRLILNRNHGAPTQFATLVHELAHLFLGHIGADTRLRVPSRSQLDRGRCEIEAESVAYIVCRRIGVEPHSERYLAEYVRDPGGPDTLDVYQVMRAAGRVESILDLADKTRFCMRYRSPAAAWT